VRPGVGKMPPKWPVGMFCGPGTFPMHFAFHTVAGRITYLQVLPEQVSGRWG